MLLYKIAEKREEKKHSPFVDSLAGALIPGTALQLGIVAGGLATFKGDKNLTDAEVGELYKAVSGGKDLKESGVSVNRMEHFPALATHYDPELKAINTSENVAAGILAHEMAHSNSPMLNHKWGPYAYTGSMHATGLMPFIGGYRLSKAIKEGKSKEELDKIKTQDDIAAVVSSTPMVAEETRANFKALQALKATNRLNARNILPLIVSEAGYLSIPALTPASHKVVEFLHRKELDKQN